MFSLLPLLLAATGAPVPTPASLVFERASEACPDRAVFASAVAARLGRDPFVDSAASETATGLHRHVRVVAEAQGAAFVVAVTFDQSARTRTFVHATCTGALEAAAVSVALALDLGPPQPANERREVVEVPGKSPLDEIDDVTAAPEPMRVLAHVALLGDIGMTPGIGASALVGATLRWEMLSLGVDGRLALPRAVAFDEEVFVDVFGAGASIHGCGHLDPVSACAVVLALDYVTTGRGFTEERTSHAPLLATGTRVALTATLHPHVSVGAFVEGLLALTKPRVLDTSGTELFSTWPVLVGAGAVVAGVW